MVSFIPLFAIENYLHLGIRSLVQPHVTGVVHACYRCYPNRQAAQRVYNNTMAAGLVHVLP